MYRIFISLLLIFFASSNIQAQRTTKIYFDKDWRVTRKVKDAEYYRIINFDAAGRPAGPVKDYFMNGKLQYEGMRTYVDTADGRNDTIVGVARWYSKKGQLVRESNYVEGKLHGDYKTWYETGSPRSTRHYENGVQEGEYVNYYENGNYRYKLNYLHGAIVGKKGTYYTSYSNKMDYFQDVFELKEDPYGWKLPDAPEVVSIIRKDTGLYIQNNSQVDAIAFLDLPFTALRGFGLRANIKKESGNPDKGYGIVYDYTDENNYSYFLVRSDGNFMTGRKNNGQETGNQKWTPTKALLGNDKTDEIRIGRKGTEMNFYINDKKIFTGSYVPFKSTNYGVICQKGDLVILVQSFYAFQW